jgi:hypothetical protein
MCLQRVPDLRHLSGEKMVREGRDRDRGLVAALDLADIPLADNGVDVSERASSSCAEIIESGKRAA